MLHPCRYKGWRWLVFSFRRSAAILSNRGNQTRSREPTPAATCRRRSCAKLRLPCTGRRLRGRRIALIRVRARHAVPHDATPVQRDDASATRYHAATAEKTPARNAACGAGSDAASAAPSPARRRDTWAVQMFAADEGVAVCWIVEQEKRVACVRSNRRHIAPETEMPC
jgi:hypothetical protein